MGTGMACVGAVVTTGTGAAIGGGGAFGGGTADTGSVRIMDAVGAGAAAAATTTLSGCTECAIVVAGGTVVECEGVVSSFVVPGTASVPLGAGK